MMDINTDNLTTFEIGQLNRLIQKMNGVKGATWIPEEGEFYFIPTPKGVKKYMNYFDSDDTAIFSVTNPHKTVASAQAKLDSIRATIQINRQVKDILMDDHPDWKLEFYPEEFPKYFPVYDYVNKKVDFTFDVYCQSNFKFVYAPLSVWRQIDTNLIKMAMEIETE